MLGRDFGQSNIGFFKGWFVRRTLEEQLRAIAFENRGNVLHLDEFFGTVLVQIILQKLLSPTTNDSHKSTLMFTFDDRNYNPAGIYNMFKVNNRNTRKRCEIVNSDHISHLFLVFLLLTLSR